LPYIKDKDRDRLDPTLEHTWPTGVHRCDSAENPGELNFQITMLCDDYLGNRGISYAVLNEVIGALECAKLEMYRRLVAPYEDKKIKENGDVYCSL